MSSLLRGINYVFHQAAQAGVRSSWGREFETYASHNILATQCLLEACKGVAIDRFIYASSSSVYGDARELPLREEGRLYPVSPYGVTKLAGEHLCFAYWKNFNVPVVSLRYFTVYGPRQRPDMAFHKFIKAIMQGREIEIYGDGEQTRDFTFVSDIVEGNLLSMKSSSLGEVFNLGGGSSATVNEVIGILGQISSVSPKVAYKDAQKGDVRHTLADTSKARDILGYKPEIDLQRGLEYEWEWLTSHT